MMSSNQQPINTVNSNLKGTTTQGDLQGSNLQGTYQDPSYGQSNLQGTSGLQGTTYGQSNLQGTTYGQTIDPLTDRSGMTGTYGTSSGLNSGMGTTGTYGSTTDNTTGTTTNTNESGGFGKTIMNASMPFIGPLRIFTFDPHATSTKLNLEENQLQYDVIVELPGIPKSNIKVQLEKNGIVEIFAARDMDDLNLLLANQVDDSGERASMKPRGEYHRRKFCVPSDANRESLRAKFENGILTITMLKLKQDELARQRADNKREYYSVE